MQKNFMYGMTLMKSLAGYPDRFLKAQKLQAALPHCIDFDLPSDDTQLKLLLDLLKNQLTVYCDAISIVIANYERLIEDAKVDCGRMRVLIESAPDDVSTERRQTMATSIVSAEQVITSVKMQVTLLRTQKQTLQDAERKLKEANNRQSAMRLAQLYKELAKRDIEIHAIKRRP